MIVPAFLASVGIFVVAMLIWVIIRGLTLPPLLRRGEPSVCGCCGYPAAFGAFERCSECGGWYRKHGILTRPLARYHRPRAWLVIASWTLLCVLIGVAGGAAIRAAMSLNNIGSTRLTLSLTAHANRNDGTTPTGVPGYTVRLDSDISVTSDGWANGGRVAIEILPDAGPIVRAEIDAPGMTWRTTGAAGSMSGQLFDEVAAREVLAAAGIDISTDYASREAALLSNSVDALITEPMVGLQDPLETMWYPPFPVIRSPTDGLPDGGFDLPVVNGIRQGASTTVHGSQVQLMTMLGFAAGFVGMIIVYALGIAFFLQRRARLFGTSPADIS